MNYGVPSPACNPNPMIDIWSHAVIAVNKANNIEILLRIFMQMHQENEIFLIFFLNLDI